MRARHDGKSVDCEQRARGGAVEVSTGAPHHPHNAQKVRVGHGDRAKLHAARRSRGGTCWYCGDKFDGNGKDSGDSAKGGYKSGGGIHIKPSHKGLLHKSLGIAAGSPIPAKALSKAKNSSSAAVRKRAVFAENAKHWHHGK